MQLCIASLCELTLCSRFSFSEGITGAVVNVVLSMILVCCNVGGPHQPVSYTQTRRPFGLL
jgi:hypothetical protein